MTISYTTYKQYRSDFCSATTALKTAKSPPKSRPSPYPFSLDNNAQFLSEEFLYQGFDICIAVEPDDALETSWLGTFSDQKGQDAICHDHKNKNSFNYFNPANTINDNREWYQNNGYSKHASYTRARSHVLNDYQTMLEIHRNGQALITVTAYLKGTKLGVEYHSSCDWDDITDTIIDNEMVEAAITQAKQTLKMLCRAYSLSFQLQEGS